MVRFATLIDSNTIFESNVINSVNFYKNVIEFIFQQISLTKQLYTPPPPFGVPCYRSLSWSTMSPSF
jgi:hypothetical protein